MNADVAADKAGAKPVGAKQVANMGTGAASTVKVVSCERLGSSMPLLHLGRPVVRPLAIAMLVFQWLSYFCAHWLRIEMASSGSHLPGSSATWATNGSWANTTIDPQSIFSTFASFEFGAGEVVNTTVYRSLTPDDTPSKYSVPSEPNSDVVESLSQEIDFSWLAKDSGLLINVGNAIVGGLEDVGMDPTLLDQTTWYDKPFGRYPSQYSLENHTPVQYLGAGTGRDDHDNAKDLEQPERSASPAKAFGIAVHQGGSETGKIRILESVTRIDPAPEFARSNVPQAAVDTEKSPINREGAPESPSTSPTSTSSDITSSEDEDHPISIANWKKFLFDRQMGYFYSLFAGCPSPSPYVRSHGSGTGGSTNSSPQRQNGGTSQSLSHSSSRGITPPGQKLSRKRKDEDEDEDEDDQGHKRPRPAPHSQPHAVDEEQQRLACPFFKKEPDKYRQRRTCSGPGWNTVHRVKEHVYRSHALPIACPICHETFENDRLKDDHLKRPERCEFREQPPIEGMDTTQKEQLRTRKQSHKSKTEAEKWNDMYLILFPRADPISLPSPYYQYTSTGADDTKGSDSEFTRYEQFLREPPVHVRRELEILIIERLNPLAENLGSELVGTVWDMQRRLLDIYKAMRSANAIATATVAATTGSETSSGSASSKAQQIDSIEVRASVENDLQPFQPPPYFENFEDFNTFNGISFDFADMQFGFIEPSSGYGLFPSEKGGGTCALDGWSDEQVFVGGADGAGTQAHVLVPIAPVVGFIAEVDTCEDIADFVAEG
ncbi:hypothetical protein BKA56DRAFT_596823 [Ilyonectria sp. MPI-CAGE-AT-0026]|nr:hypothetical protein BKA56DRAFT_596823 [Ilyonectria sp. MPI-CAGE-AT-0026]